MDELKKQLKMLDKEINTVIDLVQQVTHKRTLLSRIDALEEERAGIESELNAIEHSPASEVVTAKHRDISRFLESYKKTFQDGNIQKKKSVLSSLISKATLDGNQLFITPSYNSITGQHTKAKQTITQVRQKKIPHPDYEFTDA